MLPKRLRFDSTHPTEIIRLCRDGNLDRLREIIQDNPEIQSSSDLVEQGFRTAVEHGKINVAVFFNEEFGIELRDMLWAVEQLLTKRQLDMVKSLVTIRFLSDHVNVLLYAHTGVCWKFLFTTMDQIGSDGLLSAVSFGNLPYLRYCMKSEQAGVKTKFLAIVLATFRETQIHIYSWLMENHGEALVVTCNSGLIQENFYIDFNRLLGIVTEDNLDGFIAFYEENKPWRLWLNVIRSRTVTSLLEFAVHKGATNIFRYLIENLNNLYAITTNNNEPFNHVPSLLHLQSALCGGIEGSIEGTRADKIKLLLTTELPFFINKTILLTRLLPETLQLSLLQTVILSLSKFKQEEAQQFLHQLKEIELAHNLIITHNLLQAVNIVNLRLIFAFMDGNPDDIATINELWNIIFSKSDLFIQFINQCGAN